MLLYADEQELQLVHVLVGVLVHVIVGKDARARARQRAAAKRPPARRGAARARPQRSLTLPARRRALRARFPLARLSPDLRNRWAYRGSDWLGAAPGSSRLHHDKRLRRPRPPSSKFTTIPPFHTFVVFSNGFKQLDLQQVITCQPRPACSTPA
jgi:hypothetical protein